MRRLRSTEERVRHWDAVYTGAEGSRLSWFEDEPRCSIKMLAALGARPQDPVVDIGTGASRLIMPARLGGPLFSIDATALASLMGHVIFGLVAAAVLLVLRRRARA